MKARSASSKGSSRPRPEPSRARRRLFRLAALALPFAGLLVLEGGLRLFGFGYRTAFFLKRSVGGEPAFVENHDFARRYFPPGLARSPHPLVVPVAKGPEVSRIFIFGESAALGDPEPAFGFGRILEVLLQERYPDRKFEVLNVAVTAINSHVIRQIAGECARLRGDVWILYMGNNEVVGPFGAGTVFGAQTPPLAAVRAQIALKATRVGQFLDALRWRLAGRRAPVSWEGMEMFLKQQIPQDDPRMGRVYASFQRNLEDILQIGARAGARLLVSTLVSNLKDCPPFGSLHRPGLTATELAEWDKLYQAGAAHQAATNPAAALAAFEQAARLDDRFAELQFRMGRCHLALGQVEQARLCFERAQDLDTLRFRSDTRLNAILRQVAASRAASGVKLVDARALFAEKSPHGVPGQELLLEHVHLNFAGNHLLACALAEALADWLPAADAGANLPPLLSAEECARRLAFTDWDRLQLVEELLKRLQDPPFTHQLDHGARLQRLQAERARLLAARSQEAFPAAAALYRQAIERRPRDWQLRENFAKLLEAFGQTAEAEAQWGRVTELVPQHEQGWYGLANTLDNLGRREDAIRIFLQSLARRPDLYEARNGLGLALASQGQLTRAAEQFQQAIRRKPDAAEARVNLGQVLAQQGRLEQAKAQYLAALRANSNSVAAHVNLGKLLASQGQLTNAAAHYRQAIRLDPSSVAARYNLGNALVAQGQEIEALEHYAEAVRLAPSLAEARFNYALALGKAGRTAEALAQFQEVVRLRPDFADGHHNLGVALAQAGRFDEAIEQFLEALRLNPAHPWAQQFLQKARALRGQRP